MNVMFKLTALSNDNCTILLIIYFSDILNVLFNIFSYSKLKCYS